MTPFRDADHAIGRLLARALHPSAVSPARLNELWDHAETTGSAVLFGDALAAAGGDIAGSMRQRVEATLRAAAVDEMLRVRVLRRIVDAFEQAGVRMLLIKGAGLAYAVYRGPHLRPAGDIDVFIARDRLDASEAALTSAGFSRAQEPDVESASMQSHYSCHGAHGAEHIVDLHWRIANRHVFANALSFDDAWAASQPVPQLGASARTLGTADALLLACVHRIAHHHDDPDLVWLWDIHLLMQRTTRPDLDRLVTRAAESQMRAVVVRGLELAKEAFDTPIDPWLLAELRASPVNEPSARFIARHGRQVSLVLEDLAAVRTTGERLRLIREHLFPDVAYMSAKYPACPRPLLPLAYLHRIAHGAPRWFRREAH